MSSAWKALHPDAESAFDIDDELQVDDLACHLLERYRSEGDAEAFALLFELSRPRLLQLAARHLDTTRDDARADALVVALMHAIHDEGRAAPARISGFAVLASGRMAGLLAGAGPGRREPLQRHPLARSA